MIYFTTIKYKNFLSTGNTFTEIQLNKSRTTLVAGKNGSGKSTILDALTFALFGKPFRKINKPQLLNSINQRDCLVEINFHIGSKKYRILRGIKPAVFEIYCDDKLINQEAKSKDYQDYLEKFILKMNYKSFTQIVILGTASFVPFMQLTAADRRTIIEDLLDIQIFTTMNVILKQKMTQAKESLTKINHDMDILNVKIQSAKKLIDEIRSKNIEKIKANEIEIEDNQKQIEELTEKSKLIEKHIGILQAKIANLDKYKKQFKSLTGLEGKIESRASKIKKELEFYKTNDDCPTCQQTIESHFKTSKIDTNQSTLDELNSGLKDLEKKIDDTTKVISEMEKTFENIKNHQSEIIRHNTTIGGIQKYINKLHKENNELQNGKHSFSEEEKDIGVYEASKQKHENDKERIIGDQKYYDIAFNMLKDSGIKTRIIKQYIPVINKTINKYLAAMDFFVQFSLNEEFEETIKSRHRDEFCYANFSEGEKTRIDLALLFTWRAVAKMKNSVSTNLLILDEIMDSSLDSGAIETFLKIINELGENTNIFVISHRDDTILDKFSATIKFAKKNDFSVIMDNY